jgi:hypothetical protein
MRKQTAKAVCGCETGFGTRVAALGKLRETDNFGALVN